MRRAGRLARLTSACCSLVVSLACGTSLEEQLLTQFFQTARTLDSSLIGRLATVGFNPRTEGSVETFAIKSVGPDVPRSLSPVDEAVLASLATTGETAASATGLVVETVSREVTIDARVRTPDGNLASKTMVVTLQRSVVTGPGTRREGRWIVTALQQTPASQTSRATSSVPQM